jgi:hypothetical protein
MRFPWSLDFENPLLEKKFLLYAAPARACILVVAVAYIVNTTTKCVLSSTKQNGDVGLGVWWTRIALGIVMVLLWMLDSILWHKLRTAAIDPLLHWAVHHPIRVLAIYIIYITNVLNEIEFLQCAHWKGSPMLKCFERIPVQSISAPFAISVITINVSWGFVANAFLTIAEIVLYAVPGGEYLNGQPAETRFGRPVFTLGFCCCFSAMYWWREKEDRQRFLAVQELERLQLAAQQRQSHLASILSSICDPTEMKALVEGRIVRLRMDQGIILYCAVRGFIGWRQQYPPWVAIALMDEYHQAIEDGRAHLKKLHRVYWQLDQFAVGYGFHAVEEHPTPGGQGGANSAAPSASDSTSKTIAHTHGTESDHGKVEDSPSPSVAVKGISGAEGASSEDPAERAIQTFRRHVTKCGVHLKLHIQSTTRSGQCEMSYLPGMTIHRAIHGAPFVEAREQATAGGADSPVHLRPKHHVEAQLDSWVKVPPKGTKTTRGQGQGESTSADSQPGLIASIDSSEDSSSNSKLKSLSGSNPQVSAGYSGESAFLGLSASSLSFSATDPSRLSGADLTLDESLLLAINLPPRMIEYIERLIQNRSPLTHATWLVSWVALGVSCLLFSDWTDRGTDGAAALSLSRKKHRLSSYQLLWIWCGAMCVMVATLIGQKVLRQLRWLLLISCCSQAILQIAFILSLQESKYYFFDLSLIHLPLITFVVTSLDGVPLPIATALAIGFHINFIVFSARLPQSPLSAPDWLWNLTLMILYYPTLIGYRFISVRDAFYNFEARQLLTSLTERKRESHQRALRLFLPRYILPIVMVKLETGSNRAVADILTDVVLLTVELPQFDSLLEMEFYLRRFDDLLKVLCNYEQWTGREQAGDHTQQLIYMECFGGDRVLVSGPLRRPRNELVYLPLRSMAVEEDWVTNNHPDEILANSAAIILVQCLGELRKWKLPHLTALLHRGEGLAAVIGAARPTFSIQGAIREVSEAVLHASEPGQVLISEEFLFGFSTLHGPLRPGTTRAEGGPPLKFSRPAVSTELHPGTSIFVDYTKPLKYRLARLGFSHWFPVKSFEGPKVKSE